ncbi:peptidoglycan DD-metalloendopeptidase family protein [Tenacibaculum sp. MEBiC06402]|uniref:peptidoglycan DD-metalloendopeptidase family protein n=1 Tax=unclassified Tenacibaculum TaxID=2635139 RepID=UPI003B9A0BA7
MIEFLNTISSKALKVIDENISLKEYTPISISSDNKALETFDVSSSKEWKFFLDEFLKDRKAKVAFGGYIEKRDIYKRSAYFNSSEDEERNIHLGLDLWCDSGTKVLSVLAGEIHSFKNNLNHGDYGPTIIVKHNEQGKEFYSLYGHLSLESLENLEVGQKVKQGQVIATLGKSTINGDYAPHLHFQLILDIQDFKGDYPGVASKKDLDFYKQNCPNPNLLLKLPNEI